MNYEVEPSWLEPVQHILPRGRRRQERAQSQILAAAIDKARHRITRTSYSRRRGYYAERGKRYEPNPDLCTYDQIVPNVDQLTEFGLLQNEIAAADPTSGRQSTFRASPALIEAFGNTPPPPSVKRQPKALIELRNAEKQPIDYRDTDQTHRFRNRLLGINEMVASVSIGFPPNVGEMRGDLLIIDYSVVKLSNNSLYRVFNEDFRNGGRFYGHFVQSLPKEIRPLLTINGEPVAEPDYKSHHLRILYELKGLPLFGDPYVVDGWPRNSVKLALLIMINAPTWQKAMGAIMHRLGLSRDDAKRLVHDLKRRHQPIAEHFHSGAGCWLQRLDSDMAEIVLRGLAKRGISVLPIHDSFLVQARYGSDAEELMKEAFETVIFGIRLPHR